MAPHGAAMRPRRKARLFAPKRLVVPVDFSDPSRAAAAQAHELAVRFEAHLHLVHALASPAWTHSELRIPPSGWEAIRGQAKETLRALRMDLARDVEVSAELVEAEPVAAIRAAVERRDADLVIMGTHGYRGLKHLVLGSVAEKTLRAMPCPTLAVKPTAPAGPPTKILWATDFSPCAERAGWVARGLAVAFGARIEALHVLAPDASGTPEDSLTTARDQLEAAMEPFQQAGLEISPHVHQGAPAAAIAREAERLEVDLIAVGHRGHGGLPRAVLGSVAERTLRAAPCSVITAASEPREGAGD